MAEQEAKSITTQITPIILWIDFIFLIFRFCDCYIYAATVLKLP
ncbi:DUF2633 family protein [Flagellimonas aequoris]|uniref:DUF2633 family protein n=1 Tax=Flagellimonas aequoris TaxID=2306997 RepID=A0A418N2G1_9FLAO|nr:DUF2633 family protein [Allomuricauda aequoris]TXJ99338.1 DUF2633 family protein [Allomuricauda aequoris]